MGTRRGSRSGAGGRRVRPTEVAWDGSLGNGLAAVPHARMATNAGPAPQ